MEELALFAQIQLCERCLRCGQLRGLSAVAVWQLSEIGRVGAVSGGQGYVWQFWWGYSTRRRCLQCTDVFSYIIVVISVYCVTHLFPVAKRQFNLSSTT